MMKKVLGILMVVGYCWSLSFGHAQAAQASPKNVRTVTVAPVAKTPDTTKKQPSTVPVNVQKNDTKPSPPSDRLVPRTDTGAQKSGATAPPPTRLGVPGVGEPYKTKRRD
jgi:hypothetical protein